MASTATKDNYDLRKVWDDACDAFAKTTSEDLKKKPQYSPDEVLEQIRARQDKYEEKNAKYRVAKDVLSKTLDCIDNLGNIAAQGASMVFGPSGMCMNAISFLIATGAKYKNIFSSLTELFSRISDFLERFKIYFRMPDVDIALRRIINDLLICFVSICALSIKVLKGHKALIYLKVFAFSGDEGVVAKLGELAALVEREREMRGTLGYEVEKNIEKSVAAGRTETKEGIRALNSAVNEMAELEKKREASNIQNKQLEAIKKALDSPSESYGTIYKNLIGKKVEGTGSWLIGNKDETTGSWSQENPSYLEWATRKPASSSILCLAGGEGYGKSFLTSIVVQDLKRRYQKSNDDLSRTSVAFYYFQRESKASQPTEKDALLLNNALKSLAWQIANIDAVYRKELQASCTSIAETEEMKDLWAKLFASSYKSDATFYILLDGVDQMEEKHMKAFSQLLQQVHQRSETKDRGSLCLRILLAGRNDTIERMTKSIDDSVSIIKLASNNKDDIEKFVLDGIENIDILSGSSAQVKNLRDEIFSGLTKDAKGDFINVGLLLKQIADKTRPAEILEVLKRFQDGENRSDTIAREIEGLNKALGQQDITDLNELLTWVIVAYRTLTLGELEAVLFMKNGESGSSLQPLSESIRERYSKIFTIDREPDPVTKKTSLDATVSIVSDSIEDYFWAISAAQDKEISENTKSKGDVNESEVKIVERFLRTVCEPDLFKKFQFEQFFQNKLNSTTAVIKVDLEGAHLKIVSDCLEVICGENYEILKPLLDYATNYFPTHLAQIDLSLTVPQQKTAVGARLLKLFADKEIIARWWTDDHSEYRWVWLYVDESCDVVLNWFKDSAVVKGLRDEDKQWVKDLTSNSNPNTDLLENVAKYLCDKWLRDSYYSIHVLIYFLYGFCTKIGSRIDPKNVKRCTSDALLEDISISDIQNMLDWAKTHLVVDKLGYNETRNMARTYRECGKHEKSIELFKEAVAMEEDNWLALWGLSVAYSGQKQWTLAIETLEGVLESIRSGKAKKADPETEVAQMTRELGQYYKEAGNTEKVIQIYGDIMDKDKDDFDSAFEFLAFLREKKDFERMHGFMQKLKLSVDKEGINSWTKLCFEFAQHPTYHDMIASATSIQEAFNLVKEGYEVAVEAARTKHKVSLSLDPPEAERMIEITAFLLHYLATLVYRAQPDDAARKHGVSLWEEALQLEPNNSSYASSLRWAQRMVERRLSIVYMEQARQAGPDSEMAKDLVEKVRGLQEAGKDNRFANANLNHVLGRYFSRVGNDREAKDALRGEIKLNLDLLSDDDPTNDWQGYQGLGDNLMFAGDDDNARAAWSLITPYEVEVIEVTEDEEANKSALGIGDEKVPEHKATPAESEVPLPVSDESSPGDEKTFPKNRTSDVEPVPETTPESNPTPTLEPPKLEGPMFYDCEGNCGVQWTYADDTWVCRDCDVTLDEGCLKLLKEDKLQERICDKNHEHFHVPKYDEKAIKEIGKGNVKVGEKIMTVAEWIEDLRKEWGLALEEAGTNWEVNETKFD